MVSGIDHVIPADAGIQCGGGKTAGPRLSPGRRGGAVIPADAGIQSGGGKTAGPRGGGPGVGAINAFAIFIVGGVRYHVHERSFASFLDTGLRRQDGDSRA